MAIRARGSSLKVLAKSETVYGTAPTGNFVQLPVFTFGMSASQPLDQDNVLSTNATRDASDPNQGMISVAGDVRVPIDLENFGHWLFMLFGAAVVTGTTDFTHTWKSGAVALPSKSFEKGLADIGDYFLYTGCKANTLAIDFSPSGSADATIGLIGQDETSAGSSGGGTPTFAGMTRFRRNLGAATLDGAAMASVVGASVQYSNGLDAVHTIRSDLQLEGIDEGLSTASGNVTLRLTDSSLIADAIAQTPRALSLSYTIAATQKLTINFPRVFFSRPGVPVNGPGGIELAVQFIAAHDSVTGYMMDVVLNNQTAVYA
jgi:hypothetical protein